MDKMLKRLAKHGLDGYILKIESNRCWSSRSRKDNFYGPFWSVRISKDAIRVMQYPN